MAAVVGLFGTPLVILAVHHGRHVWLVGLSFALVLFVALGEGTYLAYRDVADALARTRTETQQAPQAAPELHFGTAYVRAPVPFHDVQNHVQEQSSFVLVPLRNDGSEDARDVLVWLTVRTPDGATPGNLADAKAHWADAHVAGQRSITLPPNHDPHAVDLVMKIDREAACWLYDDESEHNLRRTQSLISDHEFVVEAVARSSNHDDLSVIVRIRHDGTGAALEVVPEEAPTP